MLRPFCLSDFSLRNEKFHYKMTFFTPSEKAIRFLAAPPQCRCAKTFQDFHTRVKILRHAKTFHAGMKSRRVQSLAYRPMGVLGKAGGA